MLTYFEGILKIKLNGLRVLEHAMDNPLKYSVATGFTVVMSLLCNKNHTFRMLRLKQRRC
jgi:hypothetical protein